MSKKAQESLDRVRMLLLEEPSAPFVSLVSDRDVYVDSGECGWGTTVLGIQSWGTFDESSIGQSSTFRELKGFRCMLKQEKVLEVLRNN